MWISEILPDYQNLTGPGVALVLSSVLGYFMRDNSQRLEKQNNAIYDNTERIARLQNSLDRLTMAQVLSLLKHPNLPSEVSIMAEKVLRETQESISENTDCRR